MLLENARIIQNKEIDDCSFEVRSGEQFLDSSTSHVYTCSNLLVFSLLL